MGYQKLRTTPVVTLACEAFCNHFSGLPNDTEVLIRYAAYEHIRSHNHANITPKAEASFGELTPKGLKYSGSSPYRVGRKCFKIIKKAYALRALGIVNRLRKVL